MEELANLILRYQSARTLEEKERTAEEIVRLISPKLSSYLLRRYYKPHFVQDVLQDTFMKIFRELHRCRAESAHGAWGWCCRIAWHTLIDHRRRTKQEDSLDTLGSEDMRIIIEAARQKETLSQDELADLKTAMTLLELAKPDCHRLLWRHYILDEELTEMAKEDEIAYDTLRSRIRRCLEVLREIWEAGNEP